MQTLSLNEFDEKIDSLLQRLKAENKGKIVLITPLGAGKPHLLLNRIYRYAKEHSEIELTLLTALSLARPAPKKSIAKGFFDKISDKVFGNCPELEYVNDLVNNTVPENVKIKEFFLYSSVGSKSSHLQRHHISLNYSQVFNYLVNHEDVDLLLQMLAINAKGEIGLGPNPDLTKDLLAHYRDQKKKPIFIAQVSSEVPFLGSCEQSDWDYIVDCKETHHQLFSIPNLPLTYQYWLIGLFSSVLVKDGGTLQVGIGQIADSICAALLLRHHNNKLYRAILDELNVMDNFQELIKEYGGVGSFSEGINICSEMLSPGLLELFESGIAKKEIKDDSGSEASLRAAFFLGNQNFYKKLADLPEVEKNSLMMESVLVTNTQARGRKKLLERPHARFFNFTVYASVLGEAVSEATPKAKVIGGVGGQFDFCSMAANLEGARSILAFKALRNHKGETSSNIHYEGGHVTVPRHLRDIFITEYGIADLRNKTDEESILGMISITSPEFRDSLLKRAIQVGKVSKSAKYKALDHESAYSAVKKVNQNKSRSNVFPFGTCLSEVEAKGLLILLLLKEDYGLTFSTICTHLQFIFRRIFLGERPDKELRRLFDLNELSFFKKIIYESLISMQTQKLKEIYPEST